MRDYAMIGFKNLLLFFKWYGAVWITWCGDVFFLFFCEHEQTPSARAALMNGPVVYEMIGGY